MSTGLAQTQAATQTRQRTHHALTTQENDPPASESLRPLLAGSSPDPPVRANIAELSSKKGQLSTFSAHFQEWENSLLVTISSELTSSTHCPNSMDVQRKSSGGTACHASRTTTQKITPHVDSPPACTASDPATTSNPSENNT